MATHQIIDSEQLKLKTPCKIISIGCTNSGKSTLAYNFLKHWDRIFDKEFSRIIVVYQVYQPLYNKIKELRPDAVFLKGLQSTLIKNYIPDDSKSTYLLIDDSGFESTQSELIRDLFLVFSRHLNITCHLIQHEYYMKSKYSTVISANANVLIFHNNPRGVTTLRTLGSQVFPSNHKLLIDMYKQCTKDRYGYLLINFSLDANPLLKFRTDVLADEQTVLIPPVDM